MNKQSILALLKDKFNKFGLSPKGLDKLADLVLARLEALEGEPTAEQVQSEIDAVEPFAKLAQSETQLVKNALKTGKKTGDGKEGDDGSDEDKDEDGADSGNGNPKKESGKGDEVPAWAKALIDSNKALQEKLTAIEAEKSTTSRLSQYQGILDGLPDAVKQNLLKGFKRMSFEDDEDFTSWFEEQKTDVDGLKKSMVLEDAHKFGPSTAKSQGGDGGKQASQQEIADVFSSFNL